MNAVALVIGNSNYEFEFPSFSLTNPANDARGIADALTNLGFFVKICLDLKEKDFAQALHDFSTSLNNYDNCLVYFAGHAVQIDGLNFLAAIDTSFADDSSAKYTSINLDMILDYLRKCSCKVKVVILDACRNNPFASRGFGDVGLAPVKAPTGTLIAFSTSPGERAKDMGFGKNSIYTGALLKHIADKNIPIEEMFKRVRTTVYSLSEGKQISWEHTSLIGDFFFNSGQLMHSINLPYGEEYVADGKYISDGSAFGDVIAGLKVCTWSTQSSALRNLRLIKKNDISKDERFLLGRNILQAADGSEYTAVGIIERLDSYLDDWFEGKDNHVLNGMLFEMYFNSQGRFRGNKLKTSQLDMVCKLEGNKKYDASFDFINKQLLPFRELLFYIPSPNPQTVPVEYIVSDEVVHTYLGKDIKRPVLKKVMVKGNVVYEYDQSNEDFFMKTIDTKTIPSYIAENLSIPIRRLNVITNVEVPDEIRVPSRLL